LEELSVGCDEVMREGGRPPGLGLLIKPISGGRVASSIREIEIKEKGGSSKRGSRFPLLAPAGRRLRPVPRKKIAFAAGESERNRARHLPRSLKETRFHAGDKKAGCCGKSKRARSVRRKLRHKKSTL